MNYATVKDLSKQQIGQIVYTPMVNEAGKVAIEGLTATINGTVEISLPPPK